MRQKNKPPTAKDAAADRGDDFDLPEGSGPDWDQVQRIAKIIEKRQNAARTSASAERHATLLLRAMHQRIMAVLDYQCSRNRDPLRTLENIFGSHLRFVTANPLIPILLQSLIENRESGVRKVAQEMICQYEFDITLILNHAKSKDLLQPWVNAHAAANLFVAMLQGIIFRVGMTDDRTLLQEEATEIFRVYLNGLSGPAQEGIL